MIKIFLISFFVLCAPPVFSGTKWEGTIPKVAENTDSWHSLLDELLEKKMYYGALATSYRGLIYYDNLKVKQKAYKTIVNLIDQGYPSNILYMFVTGDIEPNEGANFINSYNLYKAIANETKGMKKWADDFFSKIDKENFHKYLFYQVIQSYVKNDYDVAIELLNKIFKLPLGKEHLPFITKAARTLARIYFKKEEYEKSLDIYKTFLIKLNPMHPSDWIETAWNYYYLKKHQESLGILYNLESKVVKPPHNLEKFVIRALVYLDLCSTENVDNLISNFQKTYNSAIQGIINGKPLRRHKDLLLIYSKKNRVFFNLQNFKNIILKEYKKVKMISNDNKSLAKFIYKSEFKMLKNKLSLHLEKVYDNSAKQLIMINESLKFLKFSVNREKFNPDTVFSSLDTKDNTKPYEDIGDKGFLIIWKQRGDFWRDERTKYFGDISNQCVK